MTCIEYHLLLVLICLVKSGISLDLGKNRTGYALDQKIIKFLASLPGTELVFVSRVRNLVLVFVQQVFGITVRD